MNVALILIILLVGGGVLIWLGSRQRTAHRPPVVDGPAEPRHEQPWQRRADGLGATRPSQGQVGETPGQRSAPRAEDS